MAKIADVQEVSLNLLRPYERNAKIHGPEQIEKLKDSIREFGFLTPCLIDGDLNIIAGHGRVMAAKELGMETVPCVFIEGLTDAQRRAYILADNRLGELGEWDMEIVTEELTALNDDDFDISLTGFDLDLSEPPEVNEDEFDAEPPKKAKSKRGDIYQLGDHRLMCGDSTSSTDIQLLMGGAQADMVFTDPPYGVAIGDKNKTLNTVQKAGWCCENIENDTLDEEALYEMLKAAFQNVKSVCAEDAVYYVTSPQGGSLGLMMMMMRDAGLPVRHVLIWEKNSATFSIGRLDYDYQHEPIFYTWCEKHHNYRGGEYRTTVWKYDKPRKCDLHPTMKPVALVANAILDGTLTGDIVLDVFGGSGTTLIASEDTGRKCCMMELDPRYVDVIIDRWETKTGKKAVLLNG